MDGVELLYKLKTKGAKAENRKEEDFILELKDHGLVYFEKETGLFRLHEECVVDETTEEVEVSMAPKVISLGLFIKNDNFVPVLQNKPRELFIQLNYLGAMKTIDWERILKGKNLGDEVDVEIVGYGKDENNEGFLVDLPIDVRELAYGKNKSTFTIGLGRFGKEAKTRELEFKPIRRSKITTILGVKTTQGSFKDMEEFKKAKENCVFQKAEFYC